MTSAVRSPVVVGAVALLLGSAAAPAQTSVDVENRYPNVGAIMVWRVDDSGKPIQLLGFASGSLIRARVMINNNNRLDTPAIQKWVDDTIKAHADR